MLFTLCHGQYFLQTLARSGRQSSDATFLIKRKWPKKGAAPGFHSSITPVAPGVRASLSLPRESDKERPGSPPGPLLGRQPSSGGCRPGPPAVRGGVRASTGPLVGWALPAPLGQGGGRQPSPPADRGGIWADVSPLARLIPSCEAKERRTNQRCAERFSRTWQRAPARPGGERRLGTGHETNGGPSRSPPAQPVALEGSRALPGQSLATFF